MSRLLALLFCSLPFVSHAGVISEDHPDVVMCAIAASSTTAAGLAVLYVSGIAEDGTVIYQSLGQSVLTAIFDGDGNLVGPSENSCGGQSLEELEASGNTRNF
ncbi:MAG: hypothetical protein AAF678_02245 [Pseudomonadota bacterium]